MFKNHTYCFGKIPEEYRENEYDDEYYFRFEIDENAMEVRFKDTCDRMVPVNFENLYDMHTVLTKMIIEIQQQVIGAPIR